MSRTVLIADDDDSLREVTSLLLEGEGYRVLTARTGAEALAQVRQARPDAVLLDMMMPDGDGVQFLDRLQAERSGRRPVIIAHSGFDRLEPLARSHGAATFLKKPVEARHLLDVLASYLGNRPLAPEAAAAGEASHLDAIAEAERLRDELIHRAELQAPGFRGQLRQLCAWLVGYFPSEMSAVVLVHCGRIVLLARAGFEEYPEDASLDLDASYCPEVTRAAAPLIVRETGIGGAFSSHPAAGSGLPFYAGAPLLTDGTSLGALCLRSARPFAVHAEDMAVLGHFAEWVGHAVGDTSQPLELFRADCFLAPEHLPVLVETALFRAERDRSAVALAVAAAPGIERFGRAITDAVGARSLVLALLGPGEAAIVAESMSPAEAEARVTRALGAIAVEEPIRSAITIHQPDGGRPLDPAGLLETALAAPRR